ncbi:MAG: hypothetical protein ACLVEF_00725 [Bifidobacterium bifidum]
MNQSTSYADHHLSPCTRPAGTIEGKSFADVRRKQPFPGVRGLLFPNGQKLSRARPRAAETGLSRVATSGVANSTLNGAGLTWQRAVSTPTPPARASAARC